MTGLIRSNPSTMVLGISAALVEVNLLLFNAFFAYFKATMLQLWWFDLERDISELIYEYPLVGVLVVSTIALQVHPKASNSKLLRSVAIGFLFSQLALPIAYLFIELVGPVQKFTNGSDYVVFKIVFFLMLSVLIFSVLVSSGDGFGSTSVIACLLPAIYGATWGLTNSYKYPNEPVFGWFNFVFNGFSSWQIGLLNSTKLGTVGHNVAFIVAPPCSGIEGIVLFGVASLPFLMTVNVRRITKALFFLAGVLGMVLVNLLRLALILYATYEFGYNGAEITHNHLGDVLFYAFLFAYLMLIFRFERVPAASPPTRKMS
jgi:exosortase/archaeosortase family protein